MKMFGEYKGEIISNSDPDNLNRAKIRVKGIMDGIPDSHLPWARYKSAMPAAGDTGSWIIPKKGSHVWIRFAGGDINYPYWQGGVIDDTSDKPSAVQGNRHILFESPDKGLTIAMNDDTGNIEIKTETYNTTLDKLIDAILGHTHMTSMGVSGNAQTGVPPTVALDFKAGSL